MSRLVLDRHRPTLGEATARLPRAVRVALAALGGLLLLAVVVQALRPEDRGIAVVRERAPAFNFAHAPSLRREDPRDGEYVRLARRRDDGLLVHSFAVAPLRLAPYRGEVVGALPVAAEAVIADLRRRNAGFALVQEGKTRINDVAGYAIVFTAREGERRIFGRTVMLPEPVDGARSGVRLELRSTYAGGVSRAQDVGVRGVIKQPYRTFRFGTEAP